jgi:siroheme synthase-like protein
VDKLRALIVGGGNVGSEKLHFLLKSSPVANVTIVATEISEEINTLSNLYPNVSLVNRDFNADDLDNKDLVIAATENRELNQKIRDEARKRKVLVNVADIPELCDFYLSSIVTKGDLKIAISTNGKSPIFAKRFREFLEETLPDDLQIVIENLNEIRDKLKGDFAKRVKVLNKLTSNLVTKYG